MEVKKSSYLSSCHENRNCWWISCKNLRNPPGGALPGMYGVPGNPAIQPPHPTLGGPGLLVAGAVKNRNKILPLALRCLRRCRCRMGRMECFVRSWPPIHLRWAAFPMLALAIHFPKLPVANFEKGDRPTNQAIQLIQIGHLWANFQQGFQMQVVDCCWHRTCPDMPCRLRANRRSAE